MAYFGCRARIVLTFLLCFVAAFTYAANPTLTQEQLQQLQRLPPAERDALLRALQSDQSGRQRRIPAPAESVEPRPAEEAPALAIDLAPPGPPRIKGGDTILIRFTPAPGTKEITPPPGSAPIPEQPDQDKRAKQKKAPEQKLFVLDRFGGLVLPNVGRIILAGLNEEEAAARLAVEPALQGLLIEVKLLPVQRELKPFGYDLFSGAPKTFTPATQIPVPADYIVGPGDTVFVQLFGKQNAEYELLVTRDGLLLFPDIGPIPVAGLTFSQLQQRITERVQRQLIGVKASVTLGRLRSIRVFVLGDVEKPGSYTVSGLATLTNALLASGGIQKVGTLRDIQLKRHGNIISRMDLYDLLLRGDTRSDVRLLPGDVIFVPPIGKTAGIGGWVRRPAIYELKNERTVEDLIAMAGGLLPDAFASKAQITRILRSGERTLLDADMTQPEFQKMKLVDGDVIRVPSVLEQLERVVTLSGHVERPGDYAWIPNMRLTDLIPSMSVLLPDVDANYLIIKREDPIKRNVELLSADLAAAFKKPDGAANLLLQPQDEVRVFDIHTDRSAVIEPILDRLRVQSSPDSPFPEVSIIGIVHHPGRYPWTPDMRISDLLRAAGGLTDRAYTLEAELTRFSVLHGKKREQISWTVSIKDIPANKDSPANLALMPYDQVNIQRVPNWDEIGTIEVIGEVKFPGKYVVARGEKLSNVLRRVGGLTDEAYPKGAIFTRESVRQREQEQLDKLALQLERDIVLETVKGKEPGVDKEAALAEARLLLQRTRETKAVGRMVINLEGIMRHEEKFDITVQPDDKLLIRRKPEVVTVIGEVFHPTSHLVLATLTRNQYIRLSGGVTERGNKRTTYVVHADGSVDPDRGRSGRNKKMQPGDTIVVPLKVDRINKLKLATDIAQIVFNIAFTAAALNALSN